jgi:hypothetical protein
VCMLDGRIDTQGTVKELRLRGVLEDIEKDAAMDVTQEVALSSPQSPTTAEDLAPGAEVKKPRQLVKLQG